MDKQLIKELDVSLNEKFFFFSSKKGHYFRSFTSLMKMYVPSDDFDPDGSIAKRCGEKIGISGEEMKKIWNEKGRKSIERGNQLHSEKRAEVEDYEIYTFEGENYVVNPNNIANLYELDVNACFTERTIYDLEFSVAWNADILFVKKDGSFIIVDYKSDEKIDKHSYNDEKMLKPLDRVPNSKYYKYGLEVNLGAYMLTKLGLKCEKLIISKLEPDDTFTNIPIKFNSEIVTKWLEHYKQSPNYKQFLKNAEQLQEEEIF